MDSKGDLQALQDFLQQHAEEVKSLQSIIRRAASSKKDSDQQALHQQLSVFNTQVQKLQEKVNAVKKDETSEAKEETKEKQSSQKKDKKQRNFSPEEQENAYQLKASMMPQVHSQTKMLQAELMLYNRRNELRSLRKHHQVSYNRETNLSAATTLHVISMYEKKAREAERRADSLQAELDKANGGTGTQSKPMSGPIRAEKNQSFLSPAKVEELAKKNQILVDESQDQKREIQRLKKENSELFLKVKHSSEERNHAMSQLSTSEMARRDLLTRFQRQKAQHDRLSKSLTRQSADWIEARKQRDQEEEELRWRQVGHAAPHGAHGRTFSHPVPRNVDQPRNMFPVTAYAQPSAA
ncbi:kelch-like protein 29 [Elysia marginata]|uniref:Kelch-like protein 29 n=1 Tax=Elysia marginata TaxID=1093978 RepID=A0AAV4JEB4_9GAST|nr:kelch-like protein 29 [Elysia marginata]